MGLSAGVDCKRTTEYWFVVRKEGGASCHIYSDAKLLEVYVFK
jgi:hypothetical protein